MPIRDIESNPVPEKLSWYSVPRTSRAHWNLESYVEEVRSDSRGYMEYFARSRANDEIIWEYKQD